MTLYSCSQHCCSTRITERPSLQLVSRVCGPSRSRLHTCRAAAEDAFSRLVGRPDFAQLRITPPRRRFNWPKWERWMYQQLAQKEQEEALLGGSGTDEWYFSYWDNPSAHRRWLEDAARLGVWEEALSASSSLLQGRTVLDLGCGAGTLALLAAQAGAGQVHAVDASPGAAALTRKLVAANQLGGVVSVVQGKAEVVDLPVKAVDAILCDWMGDMLLHNGMLPVLSLVRDRLLAPGGLIFPDAATLFVMGVDDREYLAEQKGFWKGTSPAGLDLSPALNAVVQYPRVDTLARRSQMVTDAQPLLTLDAYTAGLQSLSFKRPFTLTAQRPERVSALLLYFDASFTCRGALSPAPCLTTHPMAPATSWLQLILSFPRAIPLEKGQELSCVLSCTPVGSAPGRMLNLELEVEHQGLHARILYRLRQ